MKSHNWNRLRSLGPDIERVSSRLLYSHLSIDECDIGERHQKPFAVMNLEKYRRGGVEGVPNYVSPLQFSLVYLSLHGEIFFSFFSDYDRTKCKSSRGRLQYESFGRDRCAARITRSPFRPFENYRCLTVWSIILVRDIPKNYYY